MPRENALGEGVRTMFLSAQTIARYIVYVLRVFEEKQIFFFFYCEIFNKRSNNGWNKIFECVVRYISDTFDIFLRI